MTGDSAVTVTLSVSVATASARSIFSCWPIPSRTSVAFAAVKPCNVAVIS
jgi:hypothetical protein